MKTAQNNSYRKNRHETNDLRLVVMNSQWHVKGSVTWYKSTFSVCRKPDSKEPFSEKIENRKTLVKKSNFFLFCQNIPFSDLIWGKIVLGSNDSF